MPTEINQFADLEVSSVPQLRCDAKRMKPKSLTINNLGRHIISFPDGESEGLICL
jgi:hypothetical protein